MGWRDDEGNYHSVRRGIERAADRILHPFEHHRYGRRDEDIEEERGRPTRVREGVRESIRDYEPRDYEPRDCEPRDGYTMNSVPIPCHYIRIGDLLILQGRPCQVISSSPQTGQYRFLGVDLFTRQLQEESSFKTNPRPSVYVQTMLCPVYKEYRVIEIRSDGRIVCMTETGDVKYGLPVLDQGGLNSKIERAFADGRGSVRVRVINDIGRELIVDYKLICGPML